MASGGIVGKGVAVLPDVHEIFNGLYGLKGDVGKVGRVRFRMQYPEALCFLTHAQAATLRCWLLGPRSPAEIGK